MWTDAEAQGVLRLVYVTENKKERNEKWRSEEGEKKCDIWRGDDILEFYFQEPDSDLCTQEAPSRITWQLLTLNGENNDKFVTTEVPI